MDQEKRRAEQWRENILVLGLEEDAGVQEIQAAYRRLVLKCHPDVNRSREAPERFRQVVEAYGKLLEIMREKKALSGRELLARVKSDPMVRGLSAEELEKRLKYSCSPKVRAAAAAAIGVQGKAAEARRLLWMGLQDPHEGVRVAALGVMHSVCRVEDIARVIPLLCDVKSPRVRRAARAAITRILQEVFRRWGLLQGKRIALRKWFSREGAAA